MRVAILVTNDSILSGDAIHSIHDVNVCDQIGGTRSSVKWRILAQSIFYGWVETQLGTGSLGVFVKKPLLEFHVLCMIFGERKIMADDIVYKKWIVHDLDNTRINKFSREFERLNAMAWYRQCDEAEIYRAKNGGSAIHAERANRDIGHDDESEGREGQERYGKIGEEGLTFLVRKAFPHLVVPDVNYHLYKDGDQRIRFSTDVGDLYLKMFTPDVYRFGGAQIGEMQDGRQRTDIYGRIGPSWLIGSEFLARYGVEVDDTIQYKYTIEDDSVCVVGCVDPNGLCQFFGWCTYKDLRVLYFEKLMTPMYNGGKHKLGFFLFDLVEQGMLRSMNDLQESQIIRQK